MIKKLKRRRHRHKVRKLSRLVWLDKHTHIEAAEITRDYPFVGRLREAWDLKVAMQRSDQSLVTLTTYHGTEWRAYWAGKYSLPWGWLVSMVRTLPDIGPDAYQTMHPLVFARSEESAIKKAFERTLQAFPNKEITNDND